MSDKRHDSEPCSRCGKVPGHSIAQQNISMDISRTKKVENVFTEEFLGAVEY